VGHRLVKNRPKQRSRPVGVTQNRESGRSTDPNVIHLCWKASSCAISEFQRNCADIKTDFPDRTFRGQFGRVLGLQQRGVRGAYGCSPTESARKRGRSRRAAPICLGHTRLASMRLPCAENVLDRATVIL